MDLDTPEGGADVPETLVAVRDLRVAYRTKEGSIPAVRRVSLDIRAGEVLALVGESGSGKSTIGLAMLGILPETADVEGDIFYRGTRLGGLSREEMRRLRGRHIGVVFQDAQAALTPTISIGEQLAEAFRAHMDIDHAEAREAAIEALREYFSDPVRIIDSYPHQLSGGMAQRVVITMATALKPDVVIADEPTASLDAAVRHETLERLEALRDGGTAILLITHDFGVVARLADRVNVMYAGEIVEDAPVRTTFREPRHPYTYGLLRSLPSIAARGQLTPMRGHPPDLATLPPECPFLPRCNKAIAVCRTDPAPTLRPMDTVPGHLAACYNPIAVPLRD